MPIRAIGPAAAGFWSGSASNGGTAPSIELEHANDLLEARIAMERPETGVLGDEAQVSGPRLDAMLEGVEGASRLADSHPLLGSALPAIGALEQADPHDHRLAPALAAGQRFDMLGQALGDAEAAQGAETLGHRLVAPAQLVEDHHAPVVRAGGRGKELQAVAHRLERPFGVAGHPVDDRQMLQRLDAARIEPLRLLHGVDRLVMAAHRAQELAERAERLD